MTYDHIIHYKQQPYLRLRVARPELVDGHAAEGDADGAEAGDGAEQEEEDHAAVDDVVEGKDGLRRRRSI